MTEAQQRYCSSNKGKAARKRFLHSEKGKLMRKRSSAKYHLKRKAKLNWYEESRSKVLKRRYKITLEAYNTLFETQKGLCASCGEPETLINHLTNKLQPLSVDHNHNTHQNRGLVCARCNRFVIPAVEHYLEIIPKTIEYLRGYK